MLSLVPVKRFFESRFFLCRTPTIIDIFLIGFLNSFVIIRTVKQNIRVNIVVPRFFKAFVMLLREITSVISVVNCFCRKLFASACNLRQIFVIKVFLIGFLNICNIVVGCAKTFERIKIRADIRLIKATLIDSVKCVLFKCRRLFSFALCFRVCHNALHLLNLSVGQPVFSADSLNAFGGIARIGIKCALPKRGVD